jgi:hypothetical protein
VAVVKKMGDTLGVGAGLRVWLVVGMSPIFPTGFMESCSMWAASRRLAEDVEQVLTDEDGKFEFFPRRMRRNTITSCIGRLRGTRQGW